MAKGTLHTAGELHASQAFMSPTVILVPTSLKGNMDQLTCSQLKQHGKPAPFEDQALKICPLCPKLPSLWDRFVSTCLGHLQANPEEGIIILSFFRVTRIELRTLLKSLIEGTSLWFRPSATSVGKALLHLAGLELTSTHLKCPLEMLVRPGKPGTGWVPMHALGSRQWQILEQYWQSWQT